MLYSLAKRRDGSGPCDLRGVRANCQERNPQSERGRGKERPGTQLDMFGEAIEPTEQQETGQGPGQQTRPEDGGAELP